MAAAQRNFSWMDAGLFRVFTLERIYRRKGDVRRWTRGPHHLVARPGGGSRHPMVRPGGGPRHPMVRPPPGPPLSLLWTPSSCQVYRNFGFCFVQFREYFLCNFSETKKTTKNRNWHCGILLIG
jgi:hypothetical protein